MAERKEVVAKRGRVAVVMVAAVVAVAALVGEALGAAADPKGIVLRQGDLPTGFAKAASPGYEPLAKAAKADKISTATLKAYGYLNGYEADFSRDVSLNDMTSGAVDIDSSASIYRNGAGAKASLARTATACRKHGTTLSVGAKIGDASALCSIKTKTGTFTTRVYALSWRRGAVRSTVLIAGIDGGVSASEAVRLARIQDRRIP
jgi:hypothetical protein